MSAAYIMKCDDDTFVRVDTVLNEINGIDSKKSLYMGNLNLLHRPLRSGKWAVTFEVTSYCSYWFLEEGLHNILSEHLLSSAM